MPTVLITLLLAAAFGALSASHGIFPSILSLTSTAASWLLGGLVGAAVALLGRWFLARLLRAASTAGNLRIRVLNGLLVGLGSSVIGVMLFVGLWVAFPSGAAVRIAQGVCLIASVLVGLRVGIVIDRPLWTVGSAGEARHKRQVVGGRKVLDTSAIIDGRVGDLLGTGFVEGEILVPEFVLVELQGIADSSNSLRRRKGRRGLDILRSMMDDGKVPVRVMSRDYPGVREVDRKLIRLAKEEGAALVTTDYNLNRVAQLEGIRILNINELANAVKPRFIPGEGLSVQVIDRGEEINQGIGYLDDGTMVVIDNGRRHIGRTIRTTVKSTLQTEAGRMLFVEPEGESSR